MTTDVTYLLQELDGNPVAQLNLRVRGLDLTYRQARAWYWEVSQDGRIVTRGVRAASLTEIEIEIEIEIEDLLAQVQS